MNLRGAQGVVPRAQGTVYFHMVLNPPGVRAVRFEGYGPEGEAVLIDCLTGDPEGMRAQLRRVLRAHGGFLGAEGAVSYLFDRVGRMRFAADVDRVALTQAAYAAGAEAVSATGGGLEVLTDPEELEAVRSSLAHQGWAAAAAEVTERPALTLALQGGPARRMQELLEALAEVDGVRHVYSNVEISGAVLARV